MFKGKTSENVLSAKNMKEILWDTLQGLKSGEVEVSQADSMALHCREIIRVIKTQQSIIKQAGEKITDELVTYATK